MINVPDTREQIPVTVSQIMSLLYFENVNLHSKFPQGGCSKLGLFHVAQAKAGNQLSKMRGEGGREMEGKRWRDRWREKEGEGGEGRKRCMKE